MERNVESIMGEALLYVRVSSKEQEREGYSLDAQEKLGEEYARRFGLEIVKRWKVSESAWKDERDAFNVMLEYAKKHDEVRHIIFDVTDRMTRNDMDKIKIWTLVKYHNKTIHFSRSNKRIDEDSGSEDEFMLDIEVAVAKKMSNDISRKTKMGMQEKAEQGIYPSNAPLGYKNNPVTHLIDVDPERAPFIKRAFELMASGGYSLGSLAEMLNREGFRPHSSHKVNKSTLEHVLKNPVYYGVFKWKGVIYPGVHVPLVSQVVFGRAQEIMSGKFHARKSKKDFAFNNIAVCGICGCKVSGERKKNKYDYYHCTFSKGRHRELDYVPVAQFALMLGDVVRKITLPADVVALMQEGLRERAQSIAAGHESRAAILKKKYDQAEVRLSRLVDLRVDGSIEEGAFKAKEQEYKTQLAEIKMQLEACKEVCPERIEEACRTFELSNRLYSLYVNGTDEAKAKIARQIASNYSFDGATLTPTYKKPFSFWAKGLECPNWLPRMDSNHDIQIQNLKSYH